MLFIICVIKINYLIIIALENKALYFDKSLFLIKKMNILYKKIV